MIYKIIILILIHFLGDFFFQPSSWAKNKTKKFKPLLFHSIQYTIPFLIAFYFLEISLYWGILIFASHLFLDNRKFLTWWNVKIRKEKNIPNEIVLIQDQAIHILIIAIIYFFA